MKSTVHLHPWTAYVYQHQAQKKKRKIQMVQETIPLLRLSFYFIAFPHHIPTQINPWLTTIPSSESLWLGFQGSLTKQGSTAQKREPHLWHVADERDQGFVGWNVNGPYLLQRADAFTGAQHHQWGGVAGVTGVDAHAQAVDHHVWLHLQADPVLHRRGRATRSTFIL